MGIHVFGLHLEVSLFGLLLISCVYLGVRTCDILLSFLPIVWTCFIVLDLLDLLFAPPLCFATSYSEVEPIRFAFSVQSETADKYPVSAKNVWRLK